MMREITALRRPPQPGARRARQPRGGREGAPAWSAAWTASATSCAVSASMTMFRRSSARRTTCPACRGASSGPVVAGEGPVASGSVTLGTVEETGPAPAAGHAGIPTPLRRSPGGASQFGAPPEIMSPADSRQAGYGRPPVNDLAGGTWKHERCRPARPRAPLLTGLCGAGAEAGAGGRERRTLRRVRGRIAALTCAGATTFGPCRPGLSALGACPWRHAA
jgi:hypothetical protein